MGRRNNVLAGLLVIFAVVASVVIVGLLGGMLETLGWATRKIRFSLEDGVTGLKQGSEIRVGGLKVGAVSKVTPIINESTGEMEAHLVYFGIARDVKLHQNAEAELVQPLLGSSSVIDFKSLGTGPDLGPEDVLHGRLAAPSILDAAGYGDKEKTAVQNIIARVDAITAKANAFFDDVDKRRGKWFDDFDSMTTDGRVMIADGRDLAAALKKDEPVIRDKIDTAFDEARLMMSNANKLVEENRPILTSALKEGEGAAKAFRELGETLNTRTRVMVEDVLTDTRTRINAAGDSINSILTKTDNFLSEQTPVVRTALAKLRLSGDQLAATIAEVRRSPWRLIYRPDKRDLEFELLYDSARNYAQAVSELSSAAEALRGISDAKLTGGAGDAAAAKNVQDLVAQLEASRQKYDEAEKAFLEQVKKHSK